jgi:uncharacterized protein (TIGR02246 family)
MLSLRSAALVAASLIALSGCAKPPAPADTAADEAAIRAINPAWFAAHNAGDSEALVALHAEDAIVSPPDAPVRRGREAIREGFVAEIAEMSAAGLANSGGSTPVFSLSGDLGYEWNTYTVTDAAGGVVESGKYMTVYGRRDGKWVIVSDMWNRDEPAQSPAPEAETATSAG